MFPVALLKFLIVAIGQVVPAYCALHAMLHKDRQYMQYWMVYLAVANCFLVFVAPLEPALLVFFSLFPGNLYWETKLGLLISMLLPRLGVTDKVSQALATDGVERVMSVPKKLLGSGPVQQLIAMTRQKVGSKEE